MTIAAGWVRTLDGGAEELILCSDSRLSGGKRFDQGKKVFRFTRSDVAIAFAGATDWAYPMIVAAIDAAGVHLPSETRALTLPKFKTHLLRILNQMQQEVHSYAKDENIPGVTFILGGYDWCQKDFRIWRIEFSKEDKQFIAHERRGSNKFGSMGKIELAGDAEHVESLRENLKALLQERFGLDMRQPPSQRFNLEPLEALRSLVIGASSASSIGGALQAVKIYQYQNSADVGIFWPNKEDGRLFVSGRPLLEYERATVRSLLDPESLNSTWSVGNTEEAVKQINLALEKEAARNETST